MFRFRSALLPSLAVLFVAASTAYAIRASGNTPSSDPSGGTGGTPTVPPPAAVTTTGGVLSRAGLGGEQLAAAGVSSGEVARVVSAVEAFLDGSSTTLTKCDQEYAVAKGDYERLRAKVRTGVASAAVVTQARACFVDCQQKEATREDLLEGVRQAGMAVLSSSQAATLRTLESNRTWRLDMQYLAANRTEPEWVALSDALAAKAIALRNGESIPPNSAALLSRVDGEPAVSQAKTNLDTNHAAVQIAWNTAVGG